MIRPDITDPELRKEIEAYRKEATDRGGAYDPDLDAWLTEEEQEPGYWERKAALCEKLWPSKKPQAEQSDAADGETAETPPEA